MDELQYIQSLLAQGIPLTEAQQRILTQNQNNLFNPMNSDPLGVSTGVDPVQLQTASKRMSDFQTMNEYTDYVASIGGNRNEAAANWELQQTNADIDTKGPSRKITDFNTKEDYVSYRRQFGDDPTRLSQQWDDLQEGSPGTNEALLNTATQTDAAKRSGMNQLPFVSPTGADLKTDLYSLGASIAQPAGTKGKALGIASAAGSAALEIARGVTAGIGFEKRQDYINKWYQEQQRDNTYTAAPQYENTNSTGETFKYGGLFQDGGEARFDPAQSGQQMQPQPPQQTQRTTQMQQLVAMMLQDGDSPQIIVEELVSRGVPQGQAVQVVQQVTEILSRVPQQQAPMQQQQGTMEQQQAQTPEMKEGGVHGRKEGDRIRFKYGGEEYIGKIKSINGGKLILE